MALEKRAVAKCGKMRYGKYKSLFGIHKDAVVGHFAWKPGRFALKPVEIFQANSPCHPETSDRHPKCFPKIRGSPRT